jgi:hypothetical protein
MDMRWLSLVIFPIIWHRIMFGIAVKPDKVLIFNIQLNSWHHLLPWILEKTQVTG